MNASIFDGEIASATGQITVGLSQLLFASGSPAKALDRIAFGCTKYGVIGADYVL